MVTDLAFYKNIDHQIWYLGGAFAHSFSPEGQEFEWTNFEMFKCPMGFQGGGGECWSFHLINTEAQLFSKSPFGNLQSLTL